MVSTKKPAQEVELYNPLPATFHFRYDRIDGTLQQSDFMAGIIATHHYHGKFLSSRELAKRFQHVFARRGNIYNERKGYGYPFLDDEGRILSWKGRLLSGDIRFQSDKPRISPYSIETMRSGMGIVQFDRWWTSMTHTPALVMDENIETKSVALLELPAPTTDASQVIEKGQEQMATAKDGAAEGIPDSDVGKSHGPHLANHNSRRRQPFLSSPSSTVDINTGRHQLYHHLYHACYAPYALYRTHHECIHCPWPNHTA